MTRIQSKGVQSNRRVAIAVSATLTLAAAARAAEESQLEAVFVTGSRISAPNLESTSPIQVVTSDDILTSGKSDISDILNQLPQNFNNDLGQDLGNRTSGLTTAGGVSTANLRGLGPTRTLVLVNGRRLGIGSPYTFIQSPGSDLDQIPAAMVERVDVVTGGASAVYGSDAVAGVVNFIMKSNFEGLRVDAKYGFNWHDNHNDFAQERVRAFGEQPLTGTSTDGRNYAVNVTMGTNFADGNGNVTAYLGYLHAEPVRSGERDFGQCQLNSNPTLTGAVCAGSSNSNYFQPRSGPNANTVYSVLGTSFIPRGSAPTNPPAQFNSQQYIYITRGNDRYTAGVFAHMDLNDHVTPYVEFGFMNNRTHQEIAPSGLFRTSNPNDSRGNYNINCINPLLSTQQRNLLCSPAMIAADQAAYNASLVSGGPAYTPVTVNVEIGRRNVEGGGRFSDYEHTNYRAVFGLRGEISDAWSYDTYGQYFYTTFYNINSRYMNFTAIDNALIVVPTAQGPACASGAPCVPYNIFRDGGVTQAQLDYLYLDGTGYGTTTLRTVHGNVTGQLGEYGIKLPTADDGVAVNVGFEHRSENQAFKPDAAELSGQLSGFGSAAVALDNSLSVSEQFIELRAPLIQDRTAVEELVFDAGYRRSDYSTSGDVDTYKFEVQYSPIDDIRFRGSYQRAIRAPKIVELYNPQLVGLIQLGNDPCAATANPANPAIIIPAQATLSQCLRSVPASRAAAFTAAYGNGGTTNIIPQAVLGQLSQLTGGNTALQPEESDSYSFGFTFRPSFADGLVGSIDYYSIKLAGAVGVLPANSILTNCILGGDPFYCSQLTRQNTTFSLTGNNIADGGYIHQTNINIGTARVSGIDLQAAYKYELSSWGALIFATNGSYQLKSETTPLPDSPTYDCTGLFGSTCQTVTPRWRHNFRINWETPVEGLSTALTWRYLHAVRLDNNDPDPSLNFAAFGAYNYFNARIPSYSYLDLAATWKIDERFEVRGGINNLLDKDPPLATVEIVSGGAANTYSTYDAFGRQVFIQLTAKL